MPLCLAGPSALVRWLGHTRALPNHNSVPLQANLYSTSRDIPEITKKFTGCVSLEIRASEQDVRRYVEGRISDLPSFVGYRLDLQEEIKIKIVNAVDGMYVDSYVLYETPLTSLGFCLHNFILIP